MAERILQDGLGGRSAGSTQPVGRMARTGFHDLLRQAQGGNRGAMDKVLEILRPYLAPLADSFADPARPAESTSDLLQDCCLRAWRRIDTFQGASDDEQTFAMFRSWMGQIMVRTGLNAKRDRLAKSQIPPGKIRPLRTGGIDTTHPGAEVTVPDSSPTASEGVRAAETVQQIQTALDKLPDKTAAQIVAMRFFEDLTFPQIGERLGLGPDQVRDRHRTAMRRLRRDLEKWLEEWL